MLFNDLVNMQDYEERESVEPTLTTGTHTIVVQHSEYSEAREIVITLLAALISEH